MIETKVPGIKAAHAVITPNCRAVKRCPFDDAVAVLRKEYLEALKHDANKGANFNLVLTVEHPGRG